MAYLKGRGAQINPPNPFDKWVNDSSEVDWDPHAEEAPSPKTEYLNVHPKTILNPVESPDIGPSFSLNPYQGCEHGCVYCYARNTHPYWGYSAGLDFEQKILVKKNAAQLLEEKFKNPKWVATPLMLAGNTDCYQPIEKKLKITRAILEVCLKYRHPVGVITKNSLILRDLDLLTQLSAFNLVHVAISITTLDEKLRQLLEPRTASIANRFKTVKTLSGAGIPVNVMMAPIIPGLNEHEIFKLVKKSAEHGASSVNYTMVRLNGDVGAVFTDWIEKNMPDRAEKVLNKIREVHGGKLSDSRFGVRMRGEGNIADMIADQFRVARKQFLEGRSIPPYDLTLHEHHKSPQLKLF